MNHELETLKKFWNLIKPNKDSFIEIRLMPVKTSSLFWNYAENLSKEMRETPVNKKVCFFIKTYEELEKIVTYRQGYFSKNSKMCYGVNERKEINNKINGSGECVVESRFMFFDVEATDHKDIVDFKEKMFENYCDSLIKQFEKFNLFNPTIIRSGAGKHFLFKIKSQKITKGKKLWLKEFAKEFEYLNNKTFCVDNISQDTVRVLGLPGVLNPKRNKLITIEKYSEHINDFKIKSKKVPKIIPTEKFKGTKEQAINNILKNSLTKMLITHKLKPGGRNNQLIFSLKLLLIENNFKENDEFVQSLFRKIEEVQCDKFPSNFPKDENLQFNENLVNKYFIINYGRKLYVKKEKVYI